MTIEHHVEHRSLTLDACRPGGCGTIRCEGGRYCYNADGTKRPTPSSAELALTFTKILNPQNPK